jgi:integrase
LFTTTGAKPVSGYYKVRNRIASRIAEIAAEERGEPVEIDHWTFHDLRRTCATGMAKLGVPLRVGEAVLNHISGSGGGIASIYVRHDYAVEKRQALEAWARYVEDLIEGKSPNVVKLSEAAR